jgi:hypothetical protein
VKRFHRGVSARAKWDLAVTAAGLIYLGAILALNLNSPLMAILLAGAAAYEWLAHRAG